MMWLGIELGEWVILGWLTVIVASINMRIQEFRNAWFDYHKKREISDFEYAKKQHEEILEAIRRLKN